MGKRIITQRRGRGTFTYKSPSHRYVGFISHRKYDKNEYNVTYGKVIELIHCSGHSAPLAKVKYETNEHIYMPAPLQIRLGDIIASGSKAKPTIGNTLPLENIPEGSDVFNIESKPGDGGKFCRTAGSSAKIVAKLGDKIIIKFPSRKHRSFDPRSRATIGIIAGSGKKDKPFVKAGKKFHAMAARNKLYPRTSGVAMNAVDHPFGSGRGKHVGKPITPPRFAPPGRNVGLLHARRTGRKKK